MNQLKTYRIVNCRTFEVTDVVEATNSKLAIKQYINECGFETLEDYYNSGQDKIFATESKPDWTSYYDRFDDLEDYDDSLDWQSALVITAIICFLFFIFGIFVNV